MYRRKEVNQFLVLALQRCLRERERERRRGKKKLKFGYFRNWTFWPFFFFHLGSTITPWSCDKLRAKALRFSCPTIAHKITRYFFLLITRHICVSVRRTYSLECTTQISSISFINSSVRSKMLHYFSMIFNSGNDRRPPFLTNLVTLIGFHRNCELISHYKHLGGK